MATSKADEYLAKALECEKRAEQTGDNFIKQRLIEIAQSGGPWPLTKIRALGCTRLTRVHWRALWPAAKSNPRPPLSHSGASNARPCNAL